MLFVEADATADVTFVSDAEPDETYASEIETVTLTEEEFNNLKK